MDADGWRWWPERHESVRVLTRFGAGVHATAQVVVPSAGTVETVPAEGLVPITQRPWVPAEVVWRAAACRAVAALAPAGATALANRALEPLPHQLVALERALGHTPVRVLFADEVGLGKTIEAGLVLSELKARGRVRRTLIVAPKGVQLQWVAEMANHFDEQFALVGAGGVPVDAGINPWTRFDQVVCSVDAVKPLRMRKGWTPEQVRAFNAKRVEAVIAAGWDLVVFDEAHHVAGSTDDVARHRLANELVARVPNVLLLSATPHSGKSDAFARLLGLLDERFQHGLPLTREHVAPLVVRADKRRAVDNSGDPLFQPRTTTLRTVAYGDRAIEAALYDAVTEYVRYGYQRAKVENRPAIGFLVLLMQRLVSSSTAAIRSALTRRHAAIITEGTQLRLFPERAEEWGDLSGEEQVAALQDALGAAWGDELKEVEVLIDLAERAMSQGLDAKAHDLLRLIDEVTRASGDPKLKIVLFTEFVETQAMLLGVLGNLGIVAVSVDGTMSIHERAVAQQRLRDDAQVLVSTDAGGEGVNLQCAHVVINYDLPWSPSKIEQRIGRVDRIGQTHPVQAFNLVMEHSIDARVREVLESKLATILAELGADKTGDILDSAERHGQSLYTAALAGASDLDAAGDDFAEEVRVDAAQAGTFADLIDTEPTAPRVNRGAPPRRWLDLASNARTRFIEASDPGAFSGTAEADPISRLPEVSPAEPLPTITGTRSGLLCMWEIMGRDGVRAISPVFLTDDFVNRPDLAEQAWSDACDLDMVETSPPLDDSTWERLWQAGWDYGMRPDLVDSGSPPGLVLRLLMRVTA